MTTIVHRINAGLIVTSQEDQIPVTYVRRTRSYHPIDRRQIYSLLNLTGPISLAFALSRCFWILPVAVFGSGPKKTDFGTQYAGIFSRLNLIMSSAKRPSLDLSTPGLRVTKAQGDSPHRSSGLATTDTSSIAGCVYRTFSISTLLMFSPPEMMMSLDLLVKNQSKMSILQNKF